MGADADPVIAETVRSAEANAARLASALEAGLGGRSAEEILGEALRSVFKGRIALTSSFGAGSAVLLHMASRIDRMTPVLFLDTGKLFGETLRYRDDLVARLGLGNVTSARPDTDLLRRRDPEGVLWADNANACCAIRKVAPLREALHGYDAWITGRRRDQGGLRTDLRVFEVADGRIKVNPLASWARADVERYLTSNELPRHPLEADGFRSIGCMPCTARVAGDGGERDGRWAGLDKTECGIHLPAGRVAAG